MVKNYVGKRYLKTLTPPPAERLLGRPAKTKLDFPPQFD
jgi:hypothetical protein